MTKVKQNLCKWCGKPVPAWERFCVTGFRRYSKAVVGKGEWWYLASPCRARWQLANWEKLWQECSKPFDIA